MSQISGDHEQFMVTHSLKIKPYINEYSINWYNFKKKSKGFINVMWHFYVMKH